VRRNPRQLAAVRAMWLARDASAQARDISPGRVLPDRAIVAAAKAMPKTAGQLVALPEFAGKGTKRRAAYWQKAIDEARALPESALPSVRGPRSDGPPPPRTWGDRDTTAARRLTAARELMTALSEELNVPVENLLQPDALRRLCWTPPVPADAAGIAEFLRGRGAREWQLRLLSGALERAFAEAAHEPGVKASPPPQ
jgi:ribonuclease D